MENETDAREHDADDPVADAGAVDVEEGVKAGHTPEAPEEGDDEGIQHHRPATPARCEPRIDECEREKQPLHAPVKEAEHTEHCVWRNGRWHAAVRACVGCGRLACAVEGVNFSARVLT